MNNFADGTVWGWFVTVPILHMLGMPENFNWFVMYWFLWSLSAHIIGTKAIELWQARV